MIYVIFNYSVSIICRLLFLALVFMPVYVGSVSAENQRNLLNKNNNIEKRLLNKYKSTHIDIQDSDVGAVGLFRINGDLTPTDYVPLKEKDHLLRSKNLSDKFIATEASLFGVKNAANDFKEKSNVIDRHGNSHIAYYRFVNGLRLDKMEIVVHIDQAGKVFSVNGNIVPIPPMTEELIKAKNQKGLLKRKQVVAVILEDLMNVKIEKDAVKIKKLEKLAISTEPYVVWKGDVVLTKGRGRWFYIIDAHTGSIIDKMSAVRTAIHSESNSVLLDNSIVQ